MIVRASHIFLGFFSVFEFSYVKFISSLEGKTSFFEKRVRVESYFFFAKNKNNLFVHFLAIFISDIILSIILVL